MDTNFLDNLLTATRRRVDAAKRAVPDGVLRERACAMPITQNFPFERAIGKPGLSFICEVKRASPSKGLIAEHFPHADIAREYERAGADAISVLTEPDYFLGRDEFLRDISNAVSVPTLRKDFTLDEYQIFQAKLLGASAVLLICAILNADALTRCVATAHGLGLSALVETRSADEVRMALDSGARIVGVNNRDLRTFEIDATVAARLRPLAPNGVRFVAESGIKTPEDIRILADALPDAVLIGEAMMRARDRARLLRELRAAAV
jgi:indole-3-glycerol phosphate synthase